MRNILKLITCLLLSIASAALLSGCWSKTEPKDIDIVNSAIYDLTKDGIYKVTAEILNPGAMGDVGTGGSVGMGSPSYTVSGEGESLREAISKQQQNRARADFGGHADAVFLTKRFALSETISLMDLFTREYLTDERIWMVVINDDEPEKIYSSMIGMSDAVGKHIEMLSMNQPSFNSTGVFVTTLDSLKDYYDEGKEPVMGMVEMVDSTDKPSENAKIEAEGTQDGIKVYKKLLYKGLAAFRGDTLVGFFDDIGARAYNILENDLVVAYITVPSENGGYTVLRATKSNTKIKVQPDGNSVVIDVSVKVTAEVSQAGNGVDVASPEGIKEVQQGLNSILESEISLTIRKAQQEFRSDIFGFGRFLHIQSPEVWQQAKDNWNDYFADAVVNVSVDTTITYTGLIKEPVVMEEINQ